MNQQYSRCGYLWRPGSMSCIFMTILHPLFTCDYILSIRGFVVHLKLTFSVNGRDGDVKSFARLTICIK